jgi:Cu/Ag efflux pump CusA
MISSVFISQKISQIFDPKIQNFVLMIVALPIFSLSFIPIFMLRGRHKKTFVAWQIATGLSDKEANKKYDEKYNSD